MKEEALKKVTEARDELRCMKKLMEELLQGKRSEFAKLTTEDKQLPIGRMIAYDVGTMSSLATHLRRAWWLLEEVQI